MATGEMVSIPLGTPRLASTMSRNCRALSVLAVANPSQARYRGSARWARLRQGPRYRVRRRALYRPIGHGWLPDASLPSSPEPDDGGGEAKRERERHFHAADLRGPRADVPTCPTCRHAILDLRCDHSLRVDELDSQYRSGQQQAADQSDERGLQIAHGLYSHALNKAGIEHGYHRLEDLMPPDGFSEPRSNVFVRSIARQFDTAVAGLAISQSVVQALRTK
jgi:hypothetical protein